MPQDHSSKPPKGSTSKKSVNSPFSPLADDVFATEAEHPRVRLQYLFAQIEKEFDRLHTENLNLHEKVESLTEKLEREKPGISQSDSVDHEGGGKALVKKYVVSSSQKVKTTQRLRAQTSRIVSSFKQQSISSRLVREYIGHKDGIWEVSPGRPGQPIIGSASADRSACIWSVASGKCLLRYMGHGGSVNSVRFHPTRDVALTASGDCTAHVWQAAVDWEVPKGQSSEEELEEGAWAENETELDRVDTLRTPLVELTGHTGVVVSADWLPSGDQVITASWDRTAGLWDVETRELLQQLTGHDHELTHTSAHPTQRLVVTCSKDTTFRLWDFREAIHAVSVFQGHSETVTSAIFSPDDKVISGSDDRTAKVWDLRNMRSPLATIRCDSAINRLAVSCTSVLAVPHDNRRVRLFDLTGQRLARLPRTSRQGHRRMVSSVCWSDDMSNPSNFFSCGFDRRILGWAIHSMKD